MDANKHDFYKIQGYVPNDFLPEKDGCGDYLSLEINENGIVTNWYKSPDYKEFMDNGFSPQSITDVANIRNFVFNFIRPLSNKIISSFENVKGLFFERHEVHIELSVKQNKLTDCYQIWSDWQYETDKKGLELHLPKTKSVRIDYYGRKGVQFFGRGFKNINLFTDIRLDETGYYIEVLKIHRDYTDLPDNETQNMILNVFKKEFDEALKEKDELVTKLMI